MRRYRLFIFKVSICRYAKLDISLQARPPLCTESWQPWLFSLANFKQFKVSTLCYYDFTWWQLGKISIHRKLTQLNSNCDQTLPLDIGHLQKLVELSNKCKIFFRTKWWNLRQFLYGWLINIYILDWSRPSGNNLPHIVMALKIIW